MVVKISIVILKIAFAKFLIHFLLLCNSGFKIGFGFDSCVAAAP